MAGCDISRRPRKMQQALALPDSEAAKVWRIAAETALRDPFHTAEEREARAAHYMRQAEAIERGESIGINPR
jgi:hypothetical protein